LTKETALQQGSEDLFVTYEGFYLIVCPQAEIEHKLLLGDRNPAGNMTTRSVGMLEIKELRCSLYKQSVCLGSHIFIDPNSTV
jgi:hypothetical protein